MNSTDYAMYSMKNYFCWNLVCCKRVLFCWNGSD